MHTCPHGRTCYCDDDMQLKPWFDCHDCECDCEEDDDDEPEFDRYNTRIEPIDPWEDDLRNNYVPLTALE